MSDRNYSVMSLLVSSSVGLGIGQFYSVSGRTTLPSVTTLEARMT